MDSCCDVDVRTINMQTQDGPGKQQEWQVVDKIDFSNGSSGYEQMKARLKDIPNSALDQEENKERKKRPREESQQSMGDLEINKVTKK